MTAILCMLAGAGIGAGVVLILYVLGFGVELLNCACQILTCNCDGGDAIPWMWSGDSFGHVLLFCTIADAVSTGHGVIASVHAERLYFKRRPIHADLHAITITSVKKDNTGSILGFYVCDSNAFALGGTGATYYTAEEIEEALSERECNITSTIIR